MLSSSAISSGACCKRQQRRHGKRQNLTKTMLAQVDLSDQGPLPTKDRNKRKKLASKQATFYGMIVLVSIKLEPNINR